MVPKNPASSFFSSKDAVATAVAAALLLGIMIAFLTNIQVNYVPEWKEDAEYEHMSEVWEDMARLKSNVDILSAGLEINPNSRISMSAPVRMGGGELPVLGRMKTGGTLTINPQGSEIYMNIITHNGPNPKTFDCGSITYSSSNTEYIDQKFCYENGALIVSQGERSLMKLSPEITMEHLQTSYVNLTVTAVSLEGNSGTLSSNSVEEVKLTSWNREIIAEAPANIYNTSQASLAIFTEHPEAWETYLNNSILEAKINPGDYTLTANNSAVVLTLSPSEEELNVKINRAVIKIETLAQ